MISVQRTSIGDDVDQGSTCRVSVLEGRSTRPILEAKRLKKSFGGQVVLGGVDLQLCRGEIVLLRGENGSGKTTLLNILTGNLEPDGGEILYLADGSPRTYCFPRRWWQELNPLDHFTPEFVAQEGMGRTWQDVRLFGSQSLRENIAVAEQDHPGENPFFALFTPGRSNRREGEIERSSDAMLARLGLADRESSSADMISLGQSKRVAMARAVAGGAHILFLDEPLAGLDQCGVDSVLELLESFVSETNLTLVIVEHVFNQPHLSSLVTTDWLLEGGILKRNGESAAAVKPRPSLSTVENRPSWFRALSGKMAEVIDDALPLGAVLTRIRRPDMFASPPIPSLEIRNLTVKRGRRTVIGVDDDGTLSGFDLVLYEGEIALLQAPNGWGKSTLLDAICGLIPIAQGEIRLHGQPLQQLSSWERTRAGLSVLRSEYHSFPSLLGREVLRLGGEAQSEPVLDSFLDRPFSSLSGGEKQRLSLASMRSGTVSIYDEPISAMDSAEPFLRRLEANLKPHHAALVLIPSTTIVQGRNHK